MSDAQNEKTPGLSADEEQEVSHNQPPRAAVLHEIIRYQGDQELERTLAALWWSALAAGLSMGLSMMAMGLFYARLPDGDSAQVIASIGYSAGFLAVILARQQLFTENTLTAVLPVMTSPTLANFGRLLRLWGVVLLGNLAGTLLVAWVMLELPIFDSKTDVAFLEIGRKVMKNDISQMFAKGIVSLDDRHHGLDDSIHGARQDLDHPADHLPDGPWRLHPYSSGFSRGVLSGLGRRRDLAQFLAAIRLAYPGRQYYWWQLDLRPDQPCSGTQ